MRGGNYGGNKLSVEAAFDIERKWKSNCISNCDFRLSVYLLQDLKINLYHLGKRSKT